ncbi:MAG: hypothetical protein ACO2XQ_03855 [Flavobacteriales bacterium]
MKPIILIAFAAFFHSISWAQTPGNIESVEYDSSANRWFISNNNSILVTSDVGDSYEYFGNAIATHGMEAIDGHLFAIGNNVIRAYDLNTAELVGSLSISGAGFLNGMGSRSGELIVSDFSTGKLHRIDTSDPTAMSSEVLVAATGTTPNGVTIDEANNRALVVNWGNNASIISVDLETGEFSFIVPITGVGNLEVIYMDGQVRFYVSSWSPARITRYTNDFSSSETVVQGASSGLANPADISYSLQNDTLGVANSGNGTPSFHDFGSSNDLSEIDPKPENAHWEANAIHLLSPMPGVWNLTIWNTAGQLKDERSIDLSAGNASISMEQLGWEPLHSDLIQILSPLGRPFVLRPGQHRP